MATHNSTAEALARAYAKRRVLRLAQKKVAARLRAKKRAARLRAHLESGVAVCSRCKIEKPQTEFQITRKHWTGRSGHCRDCQRQRYAAYRSKNLLVARASDRARARKRWLSGDQAARRRARNELRLADPSIAISDRIRKAVRRQLQHIGVAKRAPTFELLGFTREELISHIERQFVGGMGWHNMRSWHLDHIVPLASFVIHSSSCAEFKLAWALTNLRPSWSTDNISKGAKRLFLI